MNARFRLRFVFWLDMHKPEEEALAENIEALKENRSFAQTVRDGIRLILELRAGRLELLLALFPWIWEQVELELKASQLQVTPPQNDFIHDQLQRMEQLLLQQGARPLTDLQTPLIDPDVDSELIEVQRATTNEKPGYNFLISQAKAGIGNRPLDQLPLEVIEYGIQKGLLSATLLKTAPSGKAATPNIRQIPTVEITFAAPALDDDDDLDLLTQ